MLNQNRRFSIPFMIFLLGFTFILADQDFYRYTSVVNLGTTWKVMDVVLILLLYIAIISASISSESLIYKISKPIFFPLAAFFMIAVISVVRGYLKVGTWAIGIGRYTVLDILLVTIMLSIINTEAKLKTFLLYTSILLVPIWMFHFLPSISTFPALLAGDEQARFTTAFTTAGLANMSIILFPFFLDKIEARKLWGVIPLRWLLLVSLSIVLLLQHRSVWVASLLALTIVILLAPGRLNKSRLAEGVLFTLTCTLIIAILFFIFEQFASNHYSFATVISSKLSFLHDYQGDANGYWRIRGWQYVIDRTMEINPVFGLGFSESGWYDSNNSTEVEVWEHNQYIHLFRATGIAGLSLYIVFLFATLMVWLRLLLRVKQPFYYLITVGAGAGIMMNIIYMFFYNQIVFLWVDLGILLIILRLSTKQVVSFSQAGQRIGKQRMSQLSNDLRVRPIWQLPNQ